MPFSLTQVQHTQSIAMSMGVEVEVGVEVGRQVGGGAVATGIVCA